LKLHTFLSSIPSVSPQHPLAAARDLRKKGVEVAYCLPLPTEETNWKVAFEKPTDIALVGSWPNKAAVKGKDDVEYGVDVAVQMPEVRLLVSAGYNEANMLGFGRSCSKKKTMSMQGSSKGELFISLRLRKQFKTRSQGST
jgi:hypothetical protein